MASPQKRRLPPGASSKGAGVNGPRSPPRAPRTSPTSTRSTNNATFIAPPPRAALSGASSPAPDNPRNNSNSSAASIDPPLASGSSLAPNAGPRRRTRTSRSPSPAPPTPPLQTTATASNSNLTVTSAMNRQQQQAAAKAMQTAQTALAEKDAHIAALERELALMESEFHRELDKLSRAESEAAAFWQGKVAALERTVEGLVLAQQNQSQNPNAGHRRRRGRAEDGRCLEAEAELDRGGGCRCRGEDADADADADADGQGYEKEEAEKREQEMRELRRAWVRARDEVARRDEDIVSLRAQVRGLKEWVSVSTRADGQAQTSDEVFGEGVARLGNGLQNWVLVNFRRARIDLSGADQDTLSELARLAPMYEELASTSKIHLLQSVVSRVLVEQVFDAFFVGLPGEVAGQVRQVEAYLVSVGKIPFSVKREASSCVLIFSTVPSPESINQWRSLTLSILKKDGNDKLQADTSAVVDAVVSKVNKLFEPITNTESTEAQNQGLRALVSSAIELSRLLAVQKAVFRVEMPEIVPHQRTMFNPETMEDVGGEDEDSLAGRDICCVTFPGIIKHGDESGGHLQYRNVISKAKVLCSPE